MSHKIILNYLLTLSLELPYIIIRGDNIMEIKTVPHIDYDNFETLNKLLNELSFKDLTWKNDTCPSVGLYNDDRLIQIFVDYKNPEDREDPSYTEFHLMYRDDITEEEMFFDTDDYNELINKTEEYLIVYNNTLTNSI